jgi:hypothetical protein
MNFICKIIEDRPEDRQLIVKYCRQNAPKSIDEYQQYAIDYDHLDFNDYEGFVYSLLKCGKSIIIKQLEEEPILVDSNCNDTPTYSTDISDNLNKILSIDYGKIVYEVNKLNEVNL